MGLGVYLGGLEGVAWFVGVIFGGNFLAKRGIHIPL